MSGSILVRVLAAAILAAASMQTYAAIIVDNLYMFRDLRGDNNVGVGPGDVFQYGGNVLGGSLGTSLSAVYPPSGFSDPAQVCGPLAACRT